MTASTGVTRTPSYALTPGLKVAAAAADDVGVRPLSTVEDAELRRLHALAQLGALAEPQLERYLELRRRDRRTDVREPEDIVKAMPRQRVTNAADVAAPATVA